jgi:hypothetical protein
MLVFRRPVDGAQARSVHSFWVGRGEGYGGIQTMVYVSLRVDMGDKSKGGWLLINVK